MRLNFFFFLNIQTHNFRSIYTKLKGIPVVSVYVHVWGNLACLPNGPAVVIGIL